MSNQQVQVGDIKLLERVALPVNESDGAEFVLFSEHHFALCYPFLEKTTAPLVRLHSECLTGDVAGSLRCDCGPQLEEAKKRLAAEGGYLLYLRQEGRGHGIESKIKSYQLQQDQGVDTYEAETILGHKEDIRDYYCAAQMLKLLGVPEIRLLTNNPDKAAQLEKYGCIVKEVLPTGLFKNKYNQKYLDAKKRKGHLLNV